MSDRAVILPESLRHQPQFYAFDIWMQAMFRRIDLSQILLYFVDRTNRDALEILAVEFNVPGNKGWNFAPTLPEKRRLLQMCVDLHRYSGTVWAIEKALDICGITSGTVVENCGTVGDECDWARFTVLIDGTIQMPSPVQLANAEKLINEVKNKRSVFVGFTYA